MVATSTPLVVVELLAASVWVGSLVCLAVVSSAARRVLDVPAQVAFFRAVGRRYASVGAGSLLAAIGAGLAMAWPPPAWSTTMDVAVVLAGLLLLATVLGMAQARALGSARRRAIDAPDDVAARRAARRGRHVAAVLRSVMAADTLAIVVLAAMTITR